ncbi:hypothetical protein SCP_0503520 [Sparassis crispa]|uniref:Uncharacterized protein n=1 Tax=Sparassis crispa TaxID=139825 RepID=A0A401GNI6_9APHY|nr:hypothetical protein SCP_0503520 [Sparassis crispa]GBE83304.1 hypothetical protein SCP_0503520 [Sparassis crispa]
MDHYPRLPPYSSRSCFRYHPYPRARRRYDRLERVVGAEYGDDTEDTILDSPPPISLLPSNVFGATSNDDVSTLELDDRVYQHDESDAGRKQETLQVVKQWLAKVLVVWRKCQRLRAVQAWLPAKTQ